MFFFLVAVGLHTAAFSQSDKYVAAMQKNLALFDSAKTVEDFTKVANTFEKVAKTCSKQGICTSKLVQTNQLRQLPAKQLSDSLKSSVKL